MDIPLWLKIAYTIMVVIIVPAYWRSWGPKNFLWLSDVALFGLMFALWLENGLIASTMIVMTIVVELAWLIDLIIHILTGKAILGLTDYMFSNKQPLFIRLLSLFHLPMLATMLYLLTEWGYQGNAVYYALPLAGTIFILTRFAKPEENINWVYGFDFSIIEKINVTTFITLLILTYCTIIILPTHFILMEIF